MWEGRSSTLLFLTLSSFLLKDVNVIGLEIIYIYICVVARVADSCHVGRPLA